MSIASVLSQAEDKMKKAIEATKRDFAEVSTGRANPALVEDMKISYYGAPTPLKQIASVSTSDAQTIVIQPWDKNAIADIERGVAASNLGITPNNDGVVIRLKVPPLSEERRRDLTKLVKDMAEKGKVSLRTIRRDANEQVKKIQHDKLISEDDAFKAQDKVQKLTDGYIHEVDVLLDRKSKDLLEI